MRVAKLVAANTIEVVEGAVPQVTHSKEVQVQVKAVGICGTDLHIFKGERADVALPRVMGHELSGVVTAVGSEVGRVKVGDCVVLDPVFACGGCPTCDNGFQNVCDSVKCYGVQMDGGFQDYVVVEEKHLYPYDPSISFEEAALAEPFSIAANILERTAVTEKDKVIVIGAGTIGLAIVQAVVGIGAEVVVADVVDSKLEKAMDFGAKCVVNSKKQDIKEVLQTVAPTGFNVVIDAVGITPLFEASIEYAAPRARIACIGFDGKPAQIQPVVITKKELTIVGSRMNCYQFPKVMEWLNDGKIEAEKMISKQYSVDDIQQAFEETLTNGEDVVKTLIIF